MYSSSSPNHKGLYQIGYPFSEPDVDIVKDYLPKDQLLWHVAHDYTFLDDGSLKMNVEIAYQEEEDADTDTETMFELKVSKDDLEDYSQFLKMVAGMIDNRLKRDRDTRKLGEDAPSNWIYQDSDT